MSRRLDVEPNSIAGRLMPATRIADDLLRTTFTQGGFPQALSRTASLVVVYGIRPDDAAILHLAAQDLIGGTEDDAWSVEAKVRDWTDLESQRPDCESAWNKAPVFGVIGVQTGPL